MKLPQQTKRPVSFAIGVVIVFALPWCWSNTSVVGQGVSSKGMDQADSTVQHHGSLDRLGSLPGMRSEKGDADTGSNPIRSKLLQPLTNHATGSKAARPQFKAASGLLNSQNPYLLSARFHLEQGSNRGYLVVQVELAKENYVHSLFMDKELNPSEIEVQSSENFRIMDKFQSDLEPKVIEKDPIFGKRIEKHYQKVQFFAPIIMENLDAFEQNGLPILFSGQVCSDQGMCLPIRRQTIQAEFSGFFQRNLSVQTDHSR